MPALTKRIKANRDKAFPSLIIVFLNVELSSEFLISSGRSLICSWFKNLDLNLFQIEHWALIWHLFFYKFINNDWTYRLSDNFTFKAI